MAGQRRCVTGLWTRSPVRRDTSHTRGGPGTVSGMPEPTAINESGQEPALHHEFPCNSCGAKLHFKPGTESLTCPYCGAHQVIAAPSQPVVERSFDEAMQAIRRCPVTQLAAAGREIQCQGCGAVTLVTGHAEACPFCDSPLVVPVSEDRATIVPDSLLPFAVEHKQASDSFHKWVASRWFAPNDLSKRARRSRVEGVYLPYYTYDAETYSPYRGQRGTHYYVTESYTDSEGKRQTRQVRKTRWNSVSGSVYVSFDDILICASTSLPDKLIRKLEPWDLQALRSFEPAFLSGFMAERAAVDLEQGFDQAKVEMRPGIERAIRRDIGGDEQRISSYSTSHSEVTFKLFLLPLWLSSYRYHDKVYHFVVNARTGEPVGERPYSAIKIALAVVAGIVLLAAAVFAYQYFSSAVD